jgi:long-chain fatty acid transport protein
MSRNHFVLMLLLAACTSAALATNGIRMVGFTPVSVGRGGTALGIFDRPSLMMSNPAGLSFLTGSSLDVNFSLMVPALKFTNALNSADGKTNYFPLPGVAYATTAEDLAWGVGVFTQGGMGADFLLKHALFPSAQEYHSKLAVMQGGPAVAYKLSPALSLGLSAHIVYSMMDFTMPYSLSPIVMRGIAQPGMTFGQMFAAPPAQGGFGYTEVTAAARMPDLTAFGFNGKVGLAWQATPSVTIGLSYSTPVPLTFKGGKAGMDMTAQMNDAFGKAVAGYMAQNPSATQQQAQAAVMANFAGLGIDISKGVVASYNLEAKLTLPQTIGIGASWKLSELVILAADLEWVNWKDAFDTMTLNLSGGSNTNINTMMGNNGSFTMEFPMYWANSFNIRLGGEYVASHMVTLRAGYAYGANPVPASTIFPVFPAVVENHLMIGATLGLSESMGLNLAYEMALNKSQKASAQSIVAQEYNGSTSELAENIFHISLSWKLK